MNDLQARKKELLLESELNRQLLRLEADHLRVRVQQYQRASDWIETGWKWAAPVAGFLFARQISAKAAWLSKGSALFTLARRLWAAWRSSGRTSQESNEGGPATSGPERL